MFKENENKRIALAWQRFRRIYCPNNERIGGLTGYVLADKLFEYAYHLTNSDTKIIGDYFTLEISKIEFAKNFGKTDAALRTKNKEGKTIYDLLEQELGFKFDDGNNKYSYTRNGEKVTVKAKVSTFYIPLYIEKEVDVIKNLTDNQAAKENEEKRLKLVEKEKDGKKVKNPTFNEGFREDSFFIGLYGADAYNYILNLEQQIKNNGKRLKVADINWFVENINNYKLHNNLSEEVKRVRTAYTYFCLLAKNNIDPGADSENHFKEIYSIIDNNAKGDINAVHNSLMYIYNTYKLLSLEDILRILRGYYSSNLKEKGISEKNIVEISYDNSINKLNKKIKDNPKQVVQIIEEEIKHYFQEHSAWDNDGSYYDYLHYRLNKAISKQKEKSQNELKDMEKSFATDNQNDELLG